MHDHVRRHFSTDYREVLPLHVEKGASYEELKALCPNLPKGWHELSGFSRTERIEFVAALWEMALPHSFAPFFAQMEDVGIYLFAKQEAWDVRLIYSMADGETFFQGHPPAEGAAIAKVAELFDLAFPADYVAFLKLHNGFHRDTDLGVLPVGRLRAERQVLHAAMEKLDRELLYRGAPVDPSTLYPFYKSRDLEIYQCFFTKWMPGGEIGNVFCSLSEGYLSDVLQGEEYMATLAFPSFLSWLTFYLGEMQC